MVDSSGSTGICKVEVKTRWEALKDGESFFVPCLDTINARKICMEQGYHVCRNPPIALIGVYKGMHGVLCYRDPRKFTHRLKAKPQTEWQDLI